MLLEIRGWASEALYDQVVPRLEKEGFRPRPEYAWSSPEADGEFGGMYFDYAGPGLPSRRFAALLEELSGLLSDGPGADFNLVDEASLRRRSAP